MVEFFGLGENRPKLLDGQFFDLAKISSQNQPKLLDDSIFWTWLKKNQPPKLLDGHIF
jgi:hypothetical protein